MNNTCGHSCTNILKAEFENKCDALRDFGSNAYKRRWNGWPKRRSN